MTKRDFFRILTKLLGLYIFITYLFEWVVTIFSMYAVDMEMTQFFLAITVMLIWIVIFWLLLFKTDMLIELLSLDKGFAEERIDLREMQASGLMKIGLIVIGALLVINNLATLLHALYHLFKAEVNDFNVEFEPQRPVAITITKVVLGSILLLHNDWIVKELIKKRGAQE